MKLSIIIPVYNERKTIKVLLERVLNANTCGCEKQIILVDDGSKDGSIEIINETIENNSIDSEIILVSHPENRGKGASLRDGFRVAAGDFVLIQDADLEYDPSDYSRLLLPLIEGRADVVYGSRFANSEGRHASCLWHRVGNRFLTFLSNLSNNLDLTDMECCFKVFRRDVVQRMSLKENRFGVEPEITAKVAKLKCRVMEVGVSYNPRTYAEGKKIGWRDGFRAIWCIAKYNMFI